MTPRAPMIRVLRLLLALLGVASSLAVAPLAGPAGAAVACSTPPHNTVEFVPTIPHDDVYSRERLSFGNIPNRVHSGPAVGGGTSFGGRLRMVGPNRSSTIFANDAYGTGWTDDDLPLIEILDPPDHAAGFIVIDGQVDWTAPAGYYGGDSFTYRILTPDGLGGYFCSNHALVTIAARKAASANPDAYALPDRTPFEPTRFSNLLANDENLGSPSFAHSSIWQVLGCRTCTTTAGPGTAATTAGGSVVVTESGDFTYTPKAGFVGTDEFFYALRTDAEGLDESARLGYANDDTYGTYANWDDLGDLRNAPRLWTRVTLEVPRGGVADTIFLTEDEAKTFLASDLTANDAPATTAVHSIPHFFVDESRVKITEMRPPGALSNVESFTVTPAKDFAGTAHAQYLPQFPEDGVFGQYTDIAIVVANTPDPPVAHPDGITITEDASRQFFHPLANDEDPDDDIVPTSFRRLGAPTCPDGDADPCAERERADDGTWVAGPGLLDNDILVTFVVSPSFRWEPGQIRRDVTFDYEVKDGTGSATTSTITVTVTRPATEDDTYELDEDTPLEVAAPGVFANDPAGGGATPPPVAVASAPEHGDLELEPSGALRYEPDPDFNGTDRFTYRLAGETATVHLTVAAVNDAPRLSVPGTCDATTAYDCPTGHEVVQIDEGGSVRVRGTVEDIEGDDVRLEVRWPDGTTTGLSWPCEGEACGLQPAAGCEQICALTYDVVHRFADDTGPSPQRVVVHAEDTHGAWTSEATLVEVRNVAPALVLQAPCSAPGCDTGSRLEVVHTETVELRGSLGDPGAEEGTTTIDWGDGTAPDVVPFTCSADLCTDLRASHRYVGAARDPLGYVITLTAVDGDGGEEITTARAYVSASPERCAGRVPRIVGTGGADRIFGTRGDDVIHALDGSDSVWGGAGNDTICGGGGRDLLQGGDGNDTLRGGTGSDLLIGGWGSDDLDAGDGAMDIALD